MLQNRGRKGSVMKKLLREITKTFKKLAIEIAHAVKGDRVAVDKCSECGSKKIDEIDADSLFCGDCGYEVAS